MILRPRVVGSKAGWPLFTVQADFFKVPVVVVNPAPAAQCPSAAALKLPATGGVRDGETRTS